MAKIGKLYLEEGQLIFNFSLCFGTFILFRTDLKLQVPGQYYHLFILRKIVLFQQNVYLLLTEFQWATLQCSPCKNASCTYFKPTN